MFTFGQIEFPERTMQWKGLFWRLHTYIHTVTNYTISDDYWYQSTNPQRNNNFIQKTQKITTLPSAMKNDKTHIHDIYSYWCFVTILFWILLTVSILDPHMICSHMSSFIKGETAEKEPPTLQEVKLRHWMKTRLKSSWNGCSAHLILHVYVL